MGFFALTASQRLSPGLTRISPALSTLRMRTKTIREDSAAALGLPAGFTIQENIDGVLTFETEEDADRRGGPATTAAALQVEHLPALLARSAWCSSNGAERFLRGLAARFSRTPLPVPCALVLCRYAVLLEADGHKDIMLVDTPSEVRARTQDGC